MPVIYKGEWKIKPNMYFWQSAQCASKTNISAFPQCWLPLMWYTHSFWLAFEVSLEIISPLAPGGFFFHICVGVLETVPEILQGVRRKQPPQHPEKLMITSDIKNLFSQIIGDILWHSFQQGIVTSFLTFKEGRNPFWMLIINPIPCPCLGAGKTMHFNVPS